MTRPRQGDRALFPSLTARSYLAHAAISPPPAPVARAARQVLSDFAAAGIGAFARWADDRARLREALARLVGGAPADYALVQGTTAGLILIAQSFPWRRGDRVLLFDGEFPANITPWRRAAERFGLTIDSLPADSLRGSSGEGLTRLEGLLRSGVRLVAVSAVQFQTGLAMPLAAIGALCERYGAALCVDAIQAVGVMPSDVAAWGAHFVAGGAHKWLMGLEGAGYLYIHPCYQRALRPHLAGWLSHEEPVAFLFEGPGLLRYDRPFRQAPGMFEGSSASTLGFAALRAAVELALAAGVPATYAHVQAFHDRVEPALQALGFSSLRAPAAGARSGTLALRPPPGLSAREIQRGLAERGVILTTPEGLLRVAPSWPNALDEAALVADATAEVIAGLRRG